MRRLALLTLAAICAALAGPAGAQALYKPFKTPSGRIFCAYQHYPDLKVTPHIRCDLSFLNDRAVVVGTSGRARKIKVTDAVGSPTARALAYGTATRYGAFTCTSRRTGLTCRHRGTGHGFTVSKESQKLF